MRSASQKHRELMVISRPGIAQPRDRNMKVRSTGYTLHWLLFKGLGRYLPASYARGGKLWRRIRYWMCRPLFASCGQGVNVESGATLESPWTISIGSRSGIGVDAFIGIGTQIGSNVMMGPEVLIYATNHRTSRTDVPMNEQGFTEASPVVIGDDVWIGARVIILPGVAVGPGSILGAGAVIAKDVPPGAVVVGNPGRVVRRRERSHAT